MTGQDGEQDYESRGIMERVAQALQKAGLNQTDAARKAQMIHPKAARTMFHKALQHGSRPRDAMVRAAFAEALGVDPAWLWFGRPIRRAGSPFMLGKITPADLEHYDDEEQRAEEETSSAARHREPSSGVPTTSILAIKPDPRGYALPVTHEGWEPLASPGDCLYVSPSYPPSSGDRVYVKGAEGEGIYRLAAIDADAVTLVSPAGFQISAPVTGLTIHRISAIVFS